MASNVTGMSVVSVKAGYEETDLPCLAIITKSNL